MPRGGKRLNSGRKLKSKAQRWLEGDAGKRGRVGTVPETVGTPSDPAVTAVPAELTPEEQARWRIYAPLAARNRTLTAETRPGLLLACQVSARCDQVWALLVADGFVIDSDMGKKAHPLLTHYRGLVQRVEQLLARYALAGAGKPVELPAAEEKPKDAFAAHQQGRAMLRRVK